MKLERLLVAVPLSDGSFCFTCVLVVLLLLNVGRGSAGRSLEERLLYSVSTSERGYHWFRSAYLFGSEDEDPVTLFR